MARKTLKEKQSVDTRHFYHFEKVVSPQLKKIQTGTSTTVVPDLLNTLLTTALILVTQLALFLSLKNNLIRIPGIYY